MARRQEPSEFDLQLREVFTDAAAYYWVGLMSAGEGTHRAFAALAHSAIHDELEPGDTVERRVKTVLMLVFMAGRTHVERGYESPFPRRQSTAPLPHVDADDEIPDDVAAVIEEATPLGDPPGPE